jgi:hypothetical protein
MKPSRLMLLTAVALLAPMAPALSATASAAPRPQLAIPETGFENGGTGWTFTSGAGVGTGNRHGGERFLYLDGGAGKSAQLTIVAPRNGSYDFSAWIGSAGTGGTYTIRRNGETVETITLPQHPGYATVTVRHDGATKTTLTNNSRKGSYSWEARFPGVHKNIKVNGVQQHVRTKVVNGVTYTYATPTVRAGATAVVQVTG